ncbi:response regulator transcription factor [Streptomyces sp. NPDC048057]|uniref:response regulator transcription factor n=1 Tax=Streptomyces sp. NPDC048057 TaxID=3155628 RepID=UPI0033F6A8E4
MTVPLLVAHPEGLTRGGVVQLLRAAQDMTVVAQAATPEQVVRMTDLHRPRVVVWDGSSPGFSDPETLREVVGPVTDVLLLTPSRVDRDVVRALEAGVVGFVPMNSSAAELHHAVRLVASGSGYMAPDIVRPLASAVGWRNAPTALSLGHKLTPREGQVLGFLSQGLSNARIAQELVVSENTVKTHVSRLLAKLGLRSRVEAVIAVRDAPDTLIG